MSLYYGLKQIKEELATLDENHPKAFEGWIVRKYLPQFAKDRGLRVFWPTGQSDSYDVIGWPGGERQIDAGLILEKPAEEGGNPEYIAYVAQCYAPEQYTTKPDAAKMNELQTAIDNLQLKAGNDLRLEFMQKLAEVGILTPSVEHGIDYNMPESESIQGFFFSLGDIPKVTDGTAGGDTRKLLEEKGHKFYGIEQLASWSYITNNELYPGPTEMNLNFKAITEKQNGAILGHITAGSLRDFYHEERGKSPYLNSKNHSLLNGNLRYQLRSTEPDVSKIAEGMKSTLLDKPEYFHKYNNGIVIVSESFDILEDDVVRLTKPQIVNGGQTTNAIYDFIKQYREENNSDDPDALNQALVSVKLIAENDEELVSNIARYANRQNPIDPRDEHATDNDQVNVQYPWFDQQGILWDYKRGIRGTLSGANIERFKITKKCWKEIENTQAAQNFLASIGDPVSAYTMGPDGIFRKDKLVRFIFAVHRTKELQKKAATEVSRLKVGDEAKPFPNIREGVDEFGKDSVLWWAIQRFCISVSKKGRKDRSSYVKTQYAGPAEEENLDRWNSSTYFMSNHWKYAAIHSVNLVIEKHCESEEGEVLKKAKREQMRQALLGDEYLSPEVLNKIFAKPQDWNEDITIESDSTDTILLTKDCSTNFPLLGYWLCGIEQLISGIPREERDNSKHWKTEGIYKSIQDKVKSALEQPHRFADLFPESIPTETGELQDRLDALDQASTNLLRHEINDESAPLYVRLKEKFEELLQEVPEAAADEELTIEIMRNSIQNHIHELEGKINPD
jgi:hypothetical protein